MVDLKKTSFGVAGIARLFNYASPASGYDIMQWLKPDFFDYYSETPRWTSVHVAAFLRDNPELIGENSEPPFVSEQEDIVALV